MRYALAILALAISGVLLLLGVGQRTFLAAPTEVTYPISAGQDAQYAVINAGEFSKIVGQPNLVVAGEDSFIAIAQTVDINGWLVPFDHSVVAVDPVAKAVTSSAVQGVKPTNEIISVDDEGNAVPLDPRGSDLWLDSRLGSDGDFRLPIALKDSQSILIASNGTEPVPSNVSILWVKDQSTPWAGPLLAAGGLFALAGAVLYLIAFDRDRRALGPRRGRSGPLLGVRNVVGGPRRRAKSEPSLVGDGAPKQGALSGAPALPAGTSVESTDAVDASALEEGAVAEVVVDEANVDEANTDEANTDEANIGGVDADEADTDDVVEDEAVSEEPHIDEVTSAAESGDDQAADEKGDVDAK